MIVSFNSKATEDLFHGIDSREARKISRNIWKAGWRKLDMLNAASELMDLRAPSGNRLEALKGSLKGKWSIRVNDQYRIVFEFRDGNAYEVDLVDYH